MGYLEIRLQYTCNISTVYDHIYYKICMKPILTWHKIIGAYLRFAKLEMLDDPTKESFFQGVMTKSGTLFLQ